MARVFISYSSHDRERVRLLAGVLEEAGHVIWWDPHIPLGDQYRSVIQQELHSADFVIVAWSASSILSTWVIDEAEEGKTRGSLIPVLLDPVQPPLGFRNFQVLDLTRWSGAPDAPELRRLLLGLEGRPGREAAAPARAGADGGGGGVRSEAPVGRLRGWTDRVWRSLPARLLLIGLPAFWILLKLSEPMAGAIGIPFWLIGILLLLLLGGFLVLVGPRTRRPEIPHATAHGVWGWLRRGPLVMAAGAVLGLWAVSAGGYMAMRELGIGAAATLISSGQLEESDKVLIADFENRTRDAGLSQTIEQAVSVDLSQSKLVRVVDASSAADALQRMEKEPTAPLTPALARELAQREGIATILHGEVSSLGPATIITVRLIAAKDGSILAQVQERAKKPDELLGAVDELTGELRREIGESLAVLEAEPPLEQVTTPSLPALKQYSQAVRALAQGADPKVVTLLEQALELDDSFAMAWRLLGVTLTDLGREPARALAAYTKAYQHRHRLPERERGLATGTYYFWVERDARKAVPPLETVLAAYPTDDAALNALAAYFLVLQDIKRVTPLITRLVSANPENANYRHNLFLTYIYSRQLKDAERVYHEASKQFPGNRMIHLLPILLDGARGNFPSAERGALAMRLRYASDPEVKYESARYLAIFAMATGRLTEAGRRTAEMVQMNERQKLPAAALANMVWLAGNHGWYGQAEKGRQLLRESLSRYPIAAMAPAQRPYWELAEAYAALGSAAEARSMLQRARADQVAEPVSWIYGVGDRVAGLIAMAEGKPAEAAERFQASSLIGQCLPCVLLDLGRAREAANQIPAALSAYERYVALPYEEKTEPGLVYQRLSELHERAGNREKAALYASRLVELWKNADPELQPRVAAARARLARLAAVLPARGPDERDVDLHAAPAALPRHLKPDANAAHVNWF